MDKENIAVFKRQGVLSKGELAARVEILFEQYAGAIEIEGKTMKGADKVGGMSRMVTQAPGGAGQNPAYRSTHRHPTGSRCPVSLKLARVAPRAVTATRHIDALSRCIRHVDSGPVPKAHVTALLMGDT